MMWHACSVQSPSNLHPRILASSHPSNLFSRLSTIALCVRRNVNEDSDDGMRCCHEGMRCVGRGNVYRRRRGDARHDIVMTLRRGIAMGECEPERGDTSKTCHRHIANQLHCASAGSQPSCSARTKKQGEHHRGIRRKEHRDICRQRKKEQLRSRKKGAESTTRRRRGGQRT